MSDVKKCDKCGYVGSPDEYWFHMKLEDDVYLKEIDLCRKCSKSFLDYLPEIKKIFDAF